MKIAGYLIVIYMHACMRGQLNVEKKYEQSKLEYIQLYIVHLLRLIKANC